MPEASDPLQRRDLPVIAPQQADGAVTGRVDTGVPTEPIATAVCSYVDLNFQPILDTNEQPFQTIADDAGQYSLPIPSGLPGFVQCRPPALPLVQTFTFVHARLPGETLTAQDVNPAATVVSLILQSFHRSDPTADLPAIEAERLDVIASETDLDLLVIVDTATDIYRLLLPSGLDVDFVTTLVDVLQDGQANGDNVQPIAAAINRDVSANEAERGVTVADASTRGDIRGTVTEDTEQAPSTTGGLEVEQEPTGVAQGRPVAVVTVSALQNGVEVGRGTTDAAGQYRIEDIRTGHEPFGSVSVELFVPGTSALVDVTVVAVATIQADIQVVLAAPFAVALDPQSSDLFVADFGLDAVVRLQPGEDRLTVVSGAVQGDGPALPFLSIGLGLVVETDGRLIMAGEDRVVRIAPDSGKRELVSGIDPATEEERGGGPILENVTDVAIESTNALVVVSKEGRVLRVDRETGDRTLLSGFDTDMGLKRGGGPDLESPMGITIQPTTGVLFVIDRDRGSIVRVEPDSGDRTIIRDASSEDEIPFRFPTDIVMMANGHLAVIDIGHHIVVQVDPVSGVRRLLSGQGVGTGLDFSFPFGLSVARDDSLDGSLIVADAGRGALIRVDPITGDREVEFGFFAGEGPPFANFESIAVGPDGQIALLDTGPPAIFSVDSDNGDRMILTQREVQPGCRFLVLGLGSLTIEQSGNIVVIDPGFAGDTSGGILRVDSISGATTVVTDGSDDFLDSKPQDIAIEASGQFVVAYDKKVMRVDPNTGSGFIVSGESRGDGTPFSSLGSIAVEPGGTLVVTDGEAIVRVDPDHGDRSLVSGPNRGRGAAFSCLNGIAVNADGQIVVLDSTRVIRVDPESGDRTFVSGAKRGDGSPFLVPRDLAVELSGNYLVIDQELAAVIRVDKDNGNRTIFSRLGDRDSFTRVRPDGGIEQLVIQISSAGFQTVISSSGGGCVRTTGRLSSCPR